MDGKQLVDEVREAARHHNATWEAMVPTTFVINVDLEEAEEAAYADMAAAKRRLRTHICDTYGISYRELASLARP